MPKIQNLPAAPPAPTYKVGQSLWFLMDPTDPNSECRSGIVRALEDKLIEVKSGNDIVSLEIGYDKIMTEPPAKAAAPEVVLPPVVQTPQPAGELPANTTVGDTATVGNGVKFRSSLGIETGTVQDIDGKTNDLWVLKPGNQKRTRVPRDTVTEVIVYTQVAPNVAPPPVDQTAQPPAPEVVTPTVVLPPAAPVAPTVPPTAQPAVVQQQAKAETAVAVRPAAQVATRAQYDNVKGEVFDDPDMIQMPRILIAQGVKDHELLGFTKGGIYMGLGEDPSGWVCLGKSDGKVGSRTMPGIFFCVVEMRGYWVEQVPYETEKADGTMPLIAHTQAELAQLTPKAQYEFGREARFLLAIQQPKGVESDQFRYPIGGELWALASFKAARTGFKAFVTPINTRISKIGGGKPPETWKFALHAEVIEGEKNIFGKPIVVSHGEWPAEISAELRSYAPN